MNDPIMDPVAKAHERLQQDVSDEEGLHENDRRFYKLEAFWYDAAQNKYWQPGNTNPLTAEAVDGMVPFHHWTQALDKDRKLKTMRASEWVRRIENEHLVESATWWPGKPQIIENVVGSEKGLLPKHGARCLNLYVPPLVDHLGDAAKAGPWLDLLGRLYSPEDKAHIINFCAHLVQRPDEKVNHALVLIGPEGHGKDSALQPVREAVGTWNTVEESARGLLGQFNGYLECLLLCVNEAHDLGDFDRFALAEMLKPLAAAPPEVLVVNKKHLNKYAVPNLLRVVITSNHELDCLHITAESRRYFVAQTARTPPGDAEFFAEFHRWRKQEGDAHVAAFLRSHDLTGFDPKAPPRKTPAFWAIVNSSRAPEESEMADVIAALGDPDALTIAQCIAEARKRNMVQFADYLDDRRNRKALPHRLKEAGYTVVSNPDEKGGRWSVGSKRVQVYARQEALERDRRAAVEALRRSASASKFEGDPL
jgi:hypothetical protein